MVNFPVLSSFNPTFRRAPSHPNGRGTFSLVLSRVGQPLGRVFFFFCVKRMLQSPVANLTSIVFLL